MALSHILLLVTVRWICDHRLTPLRMCLMSSNKVHKVDHVDAIGRLRQVRVTRGMSRSTRDGARVREWFMEGLSGARKSIDKGFSRNNYLRGVDAVDEVLFCIFGEFIGLLKTDGTRWYRVTCFIGQIH